MLNKAALTTFSFFCLTIFLVSLFLSPGQEESSLPTSNQEDNSYIGKSWNLMEKIFILFVELLTLFGELELELQNFAFEIVPNQSKFLLGICSSIKCILFLIGILSISTVSSLWRKFLN
jgi:hypothetical protein